MSGHSISLSLANYVAGFGNIPWHGQLVHKFSNIGKIKIASTATMVYKHFKGNDNHEDKG